MSNIPGSVTDSLDRLFTDSITDGIVPEQLTGSMTLTPSIITPSILVDSNHPHFELNQVNPVSLGMSETISVSKIYREFNLHVFRDDKELSIMNMQLMYRGGQAEIFKGILNNTNSEVAVKIVEVGPYYKCLLEQEFYYLAMLDHPNIINPIDYFVGYLDDSIRADFDDKHRRESHGLYGFMLYDWVNATKLSSWVRPGTGLLYDRKAPFSGHNFPAITSITEQQCMVLEYLLSKNLISRDWNPNNLLINENFILTLIDFGICAPLNTRGAPTGTPLYMSPKAIRENITDLFSEMFSINAIIYFMITGLPVYQSVTSADIFAEAKTFRWGDRHKQKVREVIFDQKLAEKINNFFEIGFAQEGETFQTPSILAKNFKEAVIGFNLNPDEF